MSQLIGTKRNIPPFRFDIVGSFLRTDAIKMARKKYEAGEITDAVLAAIEDEEIANLIRTEKNLGLKAVTDGEFRRSWWHLDFFLGIKGTQKIRLQQGGNFQSTKMKAETFRIIDKIAFQQHPMIEHFRYLQSVAGSVVSKFTIPSPALFHFIESQTGNTVYPDNETLLQDISKVYQEAVKSFYDAGCRYLQLDDTAWGTLCSERHRAYLTRQGKDPDKLAKDYVRLINESIAGRPSDMTVTLHICRGNFHSAWFASGSYEPIAAELFANAKVDGFFLEYDNERSGDFKPLRFIKEQIVVLGLVTTKHGGLESKEQLKAKIAEAAQYVDIEQLCLSPQCGFASTEEGNRLTEEEEWEKIRLIVETANEIWTK